MQRKEGGGSGSIAPCGGGRRGGPGEVWCRQGHAAGGGGRRSSNMREARVERGAGQGRPRLGCCHGLAQAHSADFDLKRISKPNTI
jgi:hypothetical protein